MTRISRKTSNGSDSRRTTLPPVRLFVFVFMLEMLFNPVYGDSIQLMVGGHAHGEANIRALAELGCGNFVWIPKEGYGMGNTPWDAEHDIFADVDACVETGLRFMISQRRGLGTQFKPGGFEYGGDTTPEIHDAETVRKIAERAGPLFAGLHAEELDADFVQNGLRESYRSRIPHIYSFSGRAGGREHFEAELSRIGGIYHAYGESVSYWPNLCVTLHHSGFRVNSELVMAELLESLPNTELQLAYLRGGARQFGKPWGVWVSPWHGGKVPVEDRELWPNPIAQPGAGHKLSYLRRCLYLAYVSGARVLTVQETEPLLSRKDGRYVLAGWGQELKKLWDWASKHESALEPAIPLALLVDRDNGWAPGHLHGDWIEHPSVWAKLPIGRSDRMLSGYLDALLPGFERTKGWWQPPEKLYPGFFAPTPAGAFDIVSSDAAPEKLSTYRVIALMGEIAMTPEVLATLRSYVSGGGTLLLNVNHMRLNEAFVQAPDLLGCTIGESRQWSDWSKSDLLMRAVRSGNKIIPKVTLQGIEAREYPEPAFLTQDVQAVDAEIAAVDENGRPVLLRHRSGSGQILLCTVPWMMQGFEDYSRPLEFFRALLVGLAREGAPVVTEPGSEAPAPDVSWVASHAGNATALVAIANHGPGDRRVRLSWPQETASATLEVGNGDLRSEAARGATHVFLRLPAEDVAVVRLVPKKDLAATGAATPRPDRTSEPSP